MNNQLISIPSKKKNQKFAIITFRSTHLKTIGKKKTNKLNNFHNDHIIIQEEEENPNRVNRSISPTNKRRGKKAILQQLTLLPFHSWYTRFSMTSIEDTA